MGNQLPHPHHGQGAILVLGSTGYIGKATVNALVEAKAEKVFAGMRDEAKAKDAGFPESVKAVKVDQGNLEDVAKVVKEHHIKRVFVIPPGHQDRTQIGVNAIKGAKKGGAHFIALLSVLSAPFDGTIFADQFIPIEKEVKSIGLHYTILRYPIFVDNVFMHQKSIKEEGKLVGMLAADKASAAITTADGGKAAAEVLLHPGKYNKKTFDLVSDVYTGDDLAKAFAQATGKEVKYVQVDEASVKEGMKGVGMPDWQSTGVVELYKLIDLNLNLMKSKGDLDKLGVRPTPITDFAKGVGEMFK